VAQADQAVRNLRAAGFTHDQLVVLCPDKFKDQLSPDIPRAEHPGDNAKQGIVAGGVLGATLGGLALAAVAIGTGGVAWLPAATVLIGGGAIAGGFSGLIMADGYGKGLGEYYEQAIQLGNIVVGVHIEGEDSTARLEDAARILAESGATFLTPAQA
jgi:hypothetical protein